MDNKGFFASICSFFGGLFSSDSDSSDASSNSNGVTSVEAYIRKQASAAPLTSVEQYIRNNS